MTLPHGGNIYFYADKYSIPTADFQDFSAGINPLGPPVSAMKALRGAIKELVNYPDPSGGSLTHALSESLGISETAILPGNGSTELIYLIPRALKARKALLPVPCFSEYERALRLAGSEVFYLSLMEEDGFRPDMDRLKAALRVTDMLVMCNPNNPTGVLLDKDTVLDIIKAARKEGVFTVLDEAFIEYAPEASVTSDVAGMKDVAVLRNFTKFYGMPGLRAGYLVAHPGVVERLAEYKEPWSMNTLAERAAVAALADSKYAARSIALMNKEKDYLYRNLLAMPGIYPYPPSVNFILCRIEADGVTSAGLTEGLAAKGMLIRDCSNFHGLDDRFVRLAVKRRAANRALVSALGESLSFTR